MITPAGPPGNSGGGGRMGAKRAGYEWQVREAKVG